MTLNQLKKLLRNAFASIETSVQFLEKEIDNVEVPDVTEIKTDIATIKAGLDSLEKTIDKLQTGQPTSRLTHD